MLIMSIIPCLQIKSNLFQQILWMAKNSNQPFLYRAKKLEIVHLRRFSDGVVLFMIEYFEFKLHPLHKIKNKEIKYKVWKSVDLFIKSISWSGYFSELLLSLSIKIISIYICTYFFEKWLNFCFHYYIIYIKCLDQKYYFELYKTIRSPQHAWLGVSTHNHLVT